MVERCDFYSDDEYQQALGCEEQEARVAQAMREYEEEQAYADYVAAQEGEGR